MCIRDSNITCILIFFRLIIFKYILIYNILVLISSDITFYFQIKDDKVGEVLEERNVQNMMKFISMYGDKVSQFEDELFDLNEKVEEIGKEISVLISNLEKIDPSNDFALENKRFLYFVFLLKVLYLKLGLQSFNSELRLGNQGSQDSDFKDVSIKLRI